VCGTIEPADLPACVNVLMDGFYKDMLTLAADEFSEEEMELLRPTLGFFNGYLKQFTRALLTLQTGMRLAARLPVGGMDLFPGGNALMVALQERSSGEIVGVAELSQEPRDGKVPGDIRLPRAPWAPTPERVAYICNLSVRSSWRRRGLGSSLLTACESIARHWGSDEVYLHVGADKERLLRMYRGHGYNALPEFDQPQWVLALSGREPTRYHCKAL
jgi:ribosomal protein S18 acetylase RimI-like enzyme